MFTDSVYGNRGNFLAMQEVEDREASEDFESFRIQVEKEGYLPLDNLFPSEGLRTEEAGNGLSSNGTRWILPAFRPLQDSS